MAGFSLVDLIHVMLEVGAALAIGVVLLLSGLMLRVRWLRRRGAMARRSATHLVMRAASGEALPAARDLAGDSRTLGVVVAQAIPEADAVAAARLTQWLRDEGYIMQWLKGKESHRSWQRATAASLLGDARAPEAVPMLEKGVWSKDSTVRAAAAMALADIQGPQSLPVLAAAVADGVLSHRVALAAFKRTGPDAADDVAELLWNPSALVRRVAVSAVAHRGDRQSAPALLARALDHDPEMRRSVLASLFVVDGHLDATRMRRMLTRGAHDELPTVRAAAATAIGGLLHRDGEQLLHELAHDPDFWVVARARNALAAVEGRAQEGYSTLPPDAPWPIQHAARMEEAIGDAQARAVTVP